MKRLLTILFVLSCFTGFSQVNEYRIRANMYLIADSLLIIGSDTLSGTTQIDGTDTIFVTKDYLEANFLQSEVDGSITNEIQTLSIDSVNRVFTINLTDGGSVTFQDTNTEYDLSGYATRTELHDTADVVRTEFPTTLTELDDTGFTVDTTQVNSLQTFVENNGSSLWDATTNGLSYTTGIRKGRVGIGLDARSDAGLFVSSNSYDYAAYIYNENSAGTGLYVYSYGSTSKALDINNKFIVKGYGYMQNTAYGDTLITGTVSTYAAFDVDGNIIEATGTSGSGDDWGTQTVVSDGTLSGEGTSADPLSVESSSDIWTDDGTEISVTNNENVYLGNSAPYLRFEDTDIGSVNGQEFRVQQRNAHLYIDFLESDNSTWSNAIDINSSFNVSVNVPLGVDDYIAMAEKTAPSAPSNGYGLIYATSDDSLYYKTSSGATNLMRTGSGSGGDMVYPLAGIAVSTGSAWGTSLTDNSSNWNTAYGWGDHSTAGYLTDNETITLGGDLGGSGATSITATIQSDAIEESMLKAVNEPTDEYFLTYEAITGDFEWQAGGGDGSTDLSYTASSTQGEVTSSTGTNATIPAGSTTNASLMLPGDKTKLNGIDTGADNYDYWSLEVDGTLQYNLRTTNALNLIGGTDIDLTYNDLAKSVTVDYVGTGGGGDVYKVGTPVDNQIGVWTGDGTIEGDANFTYDGTTFKSGGDINLGTNEILYEYGGVGYRMLYMDLDNFNFAALAGGHTGGVLGGSFNTFISAGGVDLTTGTDNSSYGYQALSDITTGSYNTASGRSSLQNLEGVNYNTSVGYASLLNIDMNGGGGADGNTAIGSNAGRYYTGSGNNTSAQNSVFIGRDTKASGADRNNEIVIGYDATGNGSNTVTIGNSSITENHFSGNIFASGLDDSVDDEILYWNSSTGKVTKSEARDVFMNVTTLTGLIDESDYVYFTLAGHSTTGTTYRKKASAIKTGSSHGIVVTNNNYSPTESDNVIIITSSSHSITLPTSNLYDGLTFIFANRSSGAATISTYNALDGSTSTSVPANSSVTIVYSSSETDWYQIQ